MKPLLLIAVILLCGCTYRPNKIIIIKDVNDNKIKLSCGITIPGRWVVTESGCHIIEE